MNATIYPLRPADVEEEFERDTMVARQLLYAIQTAREEGGDDWGNRIGHSLAAEPVDVLIALADSFLQSGKKIALAATAWGNECLPKHFVPRPELEADR
jgi:hypothetical protein